MRLSFNRGIVMPVIDTKQWPLRSQVKQRCLQAGDGANVLDEHLNVIASCDALGHYQAVTRAHDESSK